MRGILRWLKNEAKSPWFAMGILVAYSALDVLLVPPLVVHRVDPNRLGWFLQGHFTAALMVIVGLILSYVAILDLRDKLKNVSAEIEELRKDKAGWSDVIEYVHGILDSVTVTGDNPGFIYIMKRSDGVLKFGKTGNLNRRREAHQRDYGKRFKMVKRFAVPDQTAFERLALKLTEKYIYQEGTRRELRQMTDEQLSAFLVEFLLICREGVDA